MEHIDVFDSIYNDYLNALITGDQNQCLSMVRDLLDRNVEICDLYVRLFQRAMYEIGELWERNKISVAVEHLATAITQRLLSLVSPRIFAADHIGKKAVIACVADEYHQLGARMVADIFELHRWDGYFLGANTPPEALLEFIDHKKPDLIGLSLAICINLDSLWNTVEMVRAAFRELPILIGGQAFRWGGTEQMSRYEGVAYISSLKNLESRIT